MTLLSILCPKLLERGRSAFTYRKSQIANRKLWFHEAADKLTIDDPEGGFKAPNWFAHAAGRLKIGDVEEKGAIPCTAQFGTPMQQITARLLSKPKSECKCESCEKKLHVPKSPHHIRKAGAPKKPKHQKIHAADTASANPAFTRKSETNFILKSNKIREADSGQQTTLLPNRFRVVLITEGLGNFNDAYYYTAKALESAVPIFEGTKIYADHPTAEEEEIRPERSTRDVLGHFENLGVESNEQGCAQLCGDVDIVDCKHTEWARALMVRAIENAQKFPDKDFIGLSINAAGDADQTEIDKIIAEAPDGAKPKLEEAKQFGIDSVKVVSVINSAISCDLVTEAGAGGKIKNVIEGDENAEGKKENAKRKRR